LLDSKVYDCRHCGARNSGGGQCVNCLKSLGSFPKAVVGAAVASLGFGLFWILLSYITKVQLGVIALAFGMVVSFVTVRYSGGYGFTYQLNASFWTLLGLVVADVLVVRMLWHEYAPHWGDRPVPSLLDIGAYVLQHDGVTLAYCVIGLVGGLGIWRQPDSDH
jgi:hypothetical protein